MRLRRTWPQRLLILVNLVVIGACIAAAWGVRAAEQTALEIPRVAFGSEVLAPVDIDAGDPVTFLLVGSDSSIGADDSLQVGRDLDDEEAGRVRADVILLLRVDPRTRNAAVLSIPRDLYVPVPGSRRSWRINTALTIGGPDKLVETVSANFDVDVNHYVQVDFAGFADVIDEIGGVHVWTETALRDRRSGLFLDSAGCHQLDGSQSLAYVRGRRFEIPDDAQSDGWRFIDQRGDLDRGERQQDFLVLALDSIVQQGGRNPNEIRRLIEAASDAVVLDNSLTPDDLVDLGNSFSDFNPERLVQNSLPVVDAIIPPQNSTDEEGQSTAWPDEPVLRGDPLFVEMWDGNIGDKVLLLSERQAAPVLEVIRGNSGWVVQSDITVSIGGDDIDRTADALQYLTERDFNAFSGPTEDVAQTVIRFRPDDADRAELLARYLVTNPRFELIAPSEDDAEDEPLRLLIGPDYEGVAILPRPELEVEAAMDVLRAPTTTVVTTTTVDGSTSGAATTTAAPPSSAPGTTAPSTTESATTDDTDDQPVLTVAPTTIAPIYGRAPEGTSCP